jgi:uncharacterized protein YggE
MQNFSGWFGKLVFTVGLVFAGIGLYSRYGSGFPINQVVTQKQGFFASTGQGKVTVVPDLGIVSLGISAQANAIKDAQNQANAVIKNLSDALNKLGVDKKDIQTSNYSVYPNYSFESGANRINGYQVNANLTVKVRDLDKLNQVIDSATGVGVNQVGGIQLTVDDAKQKELLKEARDKAVADAKEKAESLAKAAGLALGRIVNVQESGGMPGPVPMMAKAQMDSGRGGGVPTQIEPGTTEITSEVTLYYETR